MTGVARGFFTSAVIYGLIGMTLGLYMGLSENHAQLTTHAHILVIGWLSFAVFGMFYASFQKAAASLLATIHFWLAQIALLGLAIGLALIYSGKPEFGPVAGIFSIGYAVSFLLFACIALPAIRGPSERT